MSTQPPLTLFLNFSGQGGVERMMLHLAKGLRDLYGGVEIVAVKTRSRYLQTETLSVPLRSLGARHTLQSLPRLALYLRTTRPAALLAAKDRANQVAVMARALAKTDTRIVLRLGTTISAAMRHKSRWHKAAWALPIRYFYPKADAIVAVSQGVAHDLQGLVGRPLDSLIVLPNPVITPHLNEQAAQPVGHPWFDDENTPVVVGMGRLTTQKDFPTLLHAFQKVRTARPCRLILLGDGSHRRSLETMAQELGIARDVFLAGFVPNPYPYLKKAAVFVLSSIWEGSPNALTEAMALGTPVVATDCPSGPREILQDGTVAPLVPMRDPEAMAQAILDMLDHPPDKERLRQAVEPYTVENSARLYLKVLLGELP
ncbi:glycosyltransferase [Desulfosoma caldarium]|uniref:Glycosyltransferase involved in cell wall biosynthesis n=1 Tax=Desulfosoma caldarium TaxID=610254 RepID=A0A3N1VJW2_9BACT|nr:glycosyltransferase [Desulfosoma caldarium]ROR03093.1 glycosyltransferase involved in cell wall biosynthesis [Desulfosoma caldarium]